MSLSGFQIIDGNAPGVTCSSISTVVRALFSFSLYIFLVVASL